MNMTLFCDECNKETGHSLRPWQSNPGMFDCISVFCEDCTKLTILKLKKGKVFDVDKIRGLKC